MENRTWMLGMPLLALAFAVQAETCQPIAPGTVARPVALNPQPEPPGVEGATPQKATWSASSDSGNDANRSHMMLNPQPEPPGVQAAPAPRAATLAASSDSGNDTNRSRMMLNPQPEPPGVQAAMAPRKATWAAGSDSGDGSSARQSVVAALQAARFTAVGHVHCEDGTWQAKARDASGEEVSLTLDGSGQILSRRPNDRDAAEDAREQAPPTR